MINNLGENLRWLNLNFKTLQSIKFESTEWLNLAGRIDDVDANLKR